MNYCSKKTLTTVIVTIVNKTFTLWLFNIAMERSTMFKFGKPSISMGHLYHGKLLVITRGYYYIIYANVYSDFSWFPVRIHKAEVGAHNA